MEIWKEVSGASMYMVSSLGRIKRLSGIIMRSNGIPMTFKKENILSPRLSKRGYYTASIRGLGGNAKIHRLVAIAFIPNPENKAQVNHKNGDRLDNRLINLEWATPLENTIHSRDVLKKDTVTHRKPVLCLNNNIVYASAADAARDLKLNHAHIRSVCRGVSNHHKKFIFKDI